MSSSWLLPARPRAGDQQCDGGRRSAPRTAYSLPAPLHIRPTLLLVPCLFSDYACPTTVFSIILATLSFIDNRPTDIAYAT
jgi:hypothetical protein